MEFVKINPADNVAVALRPLEKGSAAAGVVLTEDIPAGHKFALRAIADGEDIIKYGFSWQMPDYRYSQIPSMERRKLC